MLLRTMTVTHLVNLPSLAAGFLDYLMALFKIAWKQ